MKVCGPKYALCGLIISAWGVIQLSLMGFFFWIHSVALVEDIQVQEVSKFETAMEFYTAVDKGFTQNAMNCWIAAILYVITFGFSGYQFYLNSRSSLSV